jgi:hypothetical protein
MSFRQARRCLKQKKKMKLQKQITLRQEPSCANDRQRNSYQPMMFAQQKYRNRLPLVSTLAGAAEL